MDQQPQPLTDRIAAAIMADGMKPRAERLGLVHAMLAVVEPELAALRAEVATLTAELATVRDELAATDQHIRPSYWDNVAKYAAPEAITAYLAAARARARRHQTYITRLEALQADEHRRTAPAARPAD